MVLCGVAKIIYNLSDFGLVILSITEKKVLKSPTMVINLSIFLVLSVLLYIF